MCQEVLYEFVWIRRASQAKSLALNLLEQELVHDRKPTSGRWIRRLHIETPTLERCAPEDLRTILDYSPLLVVYSDYRSVRRNRCGEECDPRSSPEQLFSALAHPNNILKRLAWTNYDEVSFHLHVSPMLETTAANLEYLELSFCSPNLPSFTNDHDTSLPITLPALRSLKVTLDDAAFTVLSSWSMPLLTNLSVVSADFSYASQGFTTFFLIHGPQLLQLELGHSSSSIEEHYLTSPHTNPPPIIPLADWCPNLKEFICSADAEWNWQTPDWIAPHILLPTHSNLEFIGIRDICKRLRDDDLAALTFMHPPAGAWPPTTLSTDDSPFFPLLEQISSLLHHESFPSLRYIRDLSPESEQMRRAGEPRLMRFWMKVLKRCQEREVWLEDCGGVNVTMGQLKRATLGVRMVQ